MRLSWQEIRIRARAFSKRWADAHYEKGETQSFYNEFFTIFGLDRKRVAVFERKIDMIERNRRGFIDLFWPSVLLVEQKSAGKDLLRAEGQALDYVLGLRDRDMPKYVLTCDFQRFRLLELDTRREVNFTLAELHKHVEEFGFMLGVQRRQYGNQAAVNIKAAELLGTIHDALYARNYRGVELERLMVRLLFCLFADDTGIFENKDDFLYLIEERTDEDGGNVGRVLNELFEVLDTPHEQRVTGMDPEFAKFPYINGKLFTGHLRTAVFDAQMRDDLMAAAKFDWGKVSPAIFGSLFQSVMDKDERRRKGAHYTTEPNIRKVIGPLFLDELRAELDRLKARRDGGKRKELLAFQEKLGSLNFFDPACGCGNFLVVTYRELRAMEQEVLELVYDVNSPLLLEVEALSIVRLSQFHGIELDEFAAHIAEVAMWMTEHLANIELGRTFGKVFADIPLQDSAQIVHGDALEVDWETVLPHDQCFAVMGNPPFVGHQWRNKAQQYGMRNVWGDKGQFNRLDYVTCWFKKSIEYASDNRLIKIAFVSTNSICQGEQAGILWPYIFSKGVNISFAHRTFSWFSEARGKAAVHVVIVGLSFLDLPSALLFDYPDIKSQPVVSVVSRINGYLIEGPPITIPARTSPPQGLPEMFKGSQPTDGARVKLPEGGYLVRSNLILDDRERSQLLDEDPSVEKWLRQFVGGEELISGSHRWCLWLKDASPEKLRESKALRIRLDRVREGRLQSPTQSVRAFADFPWLFTQDRQPSTAYIGIPEVSSELRRYIPMAMLGSEIIASNKLQIVPLGSLYHFGVLTSLMHMAWIRVVGGRLKSDLSYSPTVYNTFPWPAASEGQRAQIAEYAQAVLNARETWPTSSLADLYDPNTMPTNLRKAHHALDLAVDRLYRRAPFAGDRDRVEHLFGLYEALVNPMAREAARQNKRVSRRATRQAAKEDDA